jgi:hypothetical protein
VVTTCAALPAGPQCSPVQGCRLAGDCVALFSQAECVARGINACGVGAGGDMCRVELADPIQNSVCVQTDSSIACGTSNLFDPGSCEGFTDGGRTSAGTCEWDDGGVQACQAAECAFFPVQSFCEAVPGCVSG